MKLLLTGINAKYIHSNPAIYSLAAYAGRFTDTDGICLREHIQIAEYTINQRLEEIEADIYRQKPDVLALSCYIWNISMVETLIADIHEIMPDLPIWLGGPEVSFHPDKVLQRFPFLAGIMIGEGEATFVELLQGYCDAKGTAVPDFSSVAGIYTKDGFTQERECMDLNEIPFFYNDLTEFENRIMYYESSRGCPFRCKYCLSSIDKKVRFRKFSLVKEELQFFLDHKVPQVKFIDRTFNAKHEHAMAVWQYILEHDNGVTNFHFEISADLLTEEEIELLSNMRKGLVQLEIGVQSTNEKTIHAINRTMDLDKLRAAVAQINNGRNIHQHLDLIAGLPYEDYESFHRSFNDVYSMRPEQLQLGFLKVLKGSMMEEQADEYGIGYRKQAPYEVLYTKWLPYDDVIRLKQIEEMVELFYNSGQFSNTIAFLEGIVGDAFLLYEKLADFYGENQYPVASSKRIAHYEHVLEFVEMLDESGRDGMLEVDGLGAVTGIQCRDSGERVEICREFLLLDTYLRENMKTAPLFAKGREMYRDYLRQFYQTEEQERKYLPDYEGFDSKQLAKMTHVEFFEYPVWKKTLFQTGEKSGFTEEGLILSKLDHIQPVLFDYRSKDPITKSCRIVLLPTQIQQKRNGTE